MKLNLLLPLALIAIVLNSCGVITKARYGNGLKLNIESNLFSKKSKSETVAKEKKKTPLQKTSQTPTEKAAEDAITEDNSEIVTTISPDKTLHFQSEKEADIMKILPGVENSTRSRIKDKIDSSKSSSATKNTKTPSREMEPLATTAGVLYYGGLVGNILYSYSALYIPLISTLLSLAVLIGFILAIIAYSNIRRNGFEKRGAGLSLSIIILTAISLLITILLVALILASL